MYTGSHTAVNLPAASQLLLWFVLPRLFLFFLSVPRVFLSPFCSFTVSFYTPFLNFCFLLSICPHFQSIFFFFYFVSIQVQKFRLHLVSCLPLLLFLFCTKTLFCVLGQRDLAILKRNASHSLQTVLHTNSLLSHGRSTFVNVSSDLNRRILTQSRRLISRYIGFYCILFALKENSKRKPASSCRIDLNSNKKVRELLN